MAFIRVFNVKGHRYYGIVENIREGKRVRQVLIKWLGKSKD